MYSTLFVQLTKGAPLGNKNAAGKHKGGGSHGSHTEAMQAAHDHIKSKGYEISDDNWQQHVAGTRKPSEGKTNSYNIPMHRDGKETDKYAHIQVYNKGGTHPYELNTYTDSGKPKIKKMDGFLHLFKGAPLGNRNAAKDYQGFTGLKNMMGSMTRRTYEVESKMHDGYAAKHLGKAKNQITGSSAHRASLEASKEHMKASTLAQGVLTGKNGRGEYMAQNMKAKQKGMEAKAWRDGKIKQPARDPSRGLSFGFAPVFKNLKGMV